MLVAGGAASAGLVHPFVGSFGTFANPQAVAVDQSSGTVYVLDVGSASVQKFDAAGNPSDFSALGSSTLDAAGGADATPEGGFSFDSNSAAELAIDNSGGPADGYLYVANSFAGVIDAFDATGTFAGEIDGSAATPQSGGETCGVATDPSGHVYAASFNGHVDKYTPTDADPAHDTFAGQLEDLGGICNIAADGSGSVYVSTWATGPLTKYAPADFDQPGPSGTVVDDTSLAVAVDPANDDVYVDRGSNVAHYNSSGALIGQSGSGHLSPNSFGVAINGATGFLYASDADAANVQRFGPAVDVDEPAVTIDQPSNVTATGATFTGTVNPQGTDPLNDTDWHFEYSTDGGGTFTSTPGGHIGTGTTPVPVSDDATGFIPNQSVQVRLVATSGAGSATSSPVSFTTAAVVPAVEDEQAQDLEPTRAALLGAIDPNNSPTSYFFEYGPTTAYGTSVPATHDASAGSENVFVRAVQRIGGLQPGTTYHFRLVAVNQAGTTQGTDQTFTTTTPPAAVSPRAGIAGTGFLPDDRAWEKVSPDRKNGGDVMAVSSRTRVATDGSAVAFASLAGFGDTLGTSVAADYMSTRSAAGWATHSIMPPQEPLSVKAIQAGVQSLYDGPFSPDLSTGFFAAWSPVTVDPNVANVANLYLRTDLRSPGAGAYTLLSPCPVCDGTDTPLPAPGGNAGGAGRPYFAGASSDFGHVIFESQEPRTTDAPGACNNNLSNTDLCPRNLYEWDHGVVRLVDYLPDDECGGTPPCTALRSQAGQGAGRTVYTPHTISADGSRIVFTVPDEAFTGIGTLYMRVNHATTVKLNASERTSPDSPSPAKYWEATADGSRVFFTTTEALTDDAPVNGDAKLYLYDAGQPDQHHLTLLSPDGVPANGADVHSVVGVGGDGHYVYFLAAGELVSGQVEADRAIYAWHDGTLRFVASVDDENDSAEDTTTADWADQPAVSRVTPDGVHLLFSSARPRVGPTGYDQTCHVVGQATCRQLYVYGYDSQRLACVSCNPSGAPATGDAFTISEANRGVAFLSSVQPQSLTDDGRRVFFNSPEPLVPHDTNGKLDVYEYDVPTGTRHLLTSGRDPSDSFVMNASPSGDDMFFVTRAQLTGADVDNSYDLYDARAGGGFPEAPPAAPDCTGEACRSPQSGAPAAGTAGTGLVTADGNVPSKPRVKPKPKPKRKPCRKGFVRKKVRGKTTCVKVKKRRHKAKRRTK